MIHVLDLKDHIVVPNIARPHQNSPCLLLSILKNVITIEMINHMIYAISPPPTLLAVFHARGPDGGSRCRMLIVINYGYVPCHYLCNTMLTFQWPHIAYRFEKYALSGLFFLAVARLFVAFGALQYPIIHPNRDVMNRFPANLAMLKV